MARALPSAPGRIAAALLLLACAGGPGTGGVPGGGGAPTVVQFTYDAVTPAAVRIAAAGNVTWVNAAADTRGYVVLPASIASSFRCGDLHPYFAKTPQGYRSQPLTGFGSERVELPCPLAPGSYDYEIWLVGAGLGTGADAVTPDQILRARIVVE